MSQSSAMANIKKQFARATLMLYKSKQTMQQSTFYNTSLSCINYCFKIAHFICARPLIMQYEKITNLFDKIHHINVPILFIHSYDDSHADITYAQKLSKLAAHSHCWWITEKSSHAKHHLIHKELYKEKLLAFINKVIH